MTNSFVVYFEGERFWGDLTSPKSPRKLGRMNDSPNFSALYDAHAAMLLRVVARAGVPSAAVEDVAAEAWLKAWAKRRTNFNGQNFQAWICEIAHNQAMDWLRRRANRHVALSPNTDSVDTRSGDPMNALLSQESRAAFRDCLGSLSEMRQAVVRARMAGESSAVIGAELGMTEEQVNRQMHVAKELLRRCVHGKLGDDGQAGDR